MMITQETMVLISIEGSLQSGSVVNFYHHDSRWFLCYSDSIVEVSFNQQNRSITKLRDDVFRNTIPSTTKLQLHGAGTFIYAVDKTSVHFIQGCEENFTMAIGNR